MPPQTWKDILQKRPIHDIESSQGHEWVATGSSGGRKIVVRRVQSAQVEKQQRIIYYKCSKCGTTGRKKVGITCVIADQHANLTCNEVIIKNIIQ